MMRKFETTEVFRMIEREGAQTLSVVPAMATALVNCPERPKFNLKSLQRMNIGGAASSPTLVREVEEKLGCACYSGYGLTETAPVLTTARMKAGVDWQGQTRYRKIGQHRPRQSSRWNIVWSIPKRKRCSLVARALERSWPAVTV